MASVNSLSMNPRDKETSYADNSSLQKRVLLKTRPILEDSIKDMMRQIFPVTCVKIAELGCASGPNTFFPTHVIIETITEICEREEWEEAPEIQVFLNDLPQNDFNAVFRSVPAGLFNGTRSNCFVAGVAGSFYQRLFPTKSIHFMHSSYCLHWLSKVPEGIENNKGNIYITKSSPPNVLKAYSEQFQKDFSNFLRSRSQEMINGGGGGRMLLTLLGRSSDDDPTTKDCYIPQLDLLAKSLLDLVHQGVVQECDVDSFNIPFYIPCKEEVMKIIEMKESFVLDKMKIFEENLDFEDDDDNDENFVFDKSKSGQNVAKYMRAITESMLAKHFGETILDDLFSKYAQHMGEHLSREKSKDVNIVLLLNKK